MKKEVRALRQAGKKRTLKAQEEKWKLLLEVTGQENEDESTA